MLFAEAGQVEAWWLPIVGAIGTAISLLVTQVFKHLRSQPTVASKVKRTETKELQQHWHDFVETLKTDSASFRQTIVELRVAHEQKIAECAGLQVKADYLEAENAELKAEAAELRAELRKR